MVEIMRTVGHDSEMVLLTTETFDSWLRRLRDKQGVEVVILLCGGDKKSQQKDIGRAKLMAKEIRESERRI